MPVVDSKREESMLNTGRLAAAVVNSVNNEWNQHKWRGEAEICFKQAVETMKIHDPLKARDKDKFALLCEMPLNLKWRLDEQRPDGCRDAMDNLDFRRWLAKQPELEYLKLYPLFTKDWNSF